MNINQPAWLEDNSTVLMPYDPAWAIAFEEEAKCITALIGNEAIAIHHIGSTSVPGMVAKPLVDMLVEIEGETLSEHAINKLIDNGYIKKVFADHKEIMFMKGTDTKRTHNIHFGQRDSKFNQALLQFKELLCSDPKLKAEYIELKLRLAAENADDRKKYYAGKDAFLNAAAPRK